MAANQQIKNEKDEQIQALAKQVLSLARDNILVAMRFFDVALTGLSWKESGRTGQVATDGRTLQYDAVHILQEYQKEPQRVTRTLLHVLLHCIFYHNFQYDKVDRECWDLAVDMAVEHTILDMHLHAVTLSTDAEAAVKLRVWKEDVGALTAEKIYRYMKANPVSDREKQELNRLFYRDSHHLWQQAEELVVTQQQWQKISERMKADLKSFTKARSNTESLEENLKEATRDRYDYAEILSRFSVMGENVTVNDEEFDYVYYTYGLELYGNMPLVEPLEYRESKKVKEFVIALDTSASCRGSVVREFLNKTYSILKGRENFFSKINVHIIQCDNAVQQDTKITGDEDFEAFLKNGRLQGFGGTDFRPVFEYVDKLREQGEFENLKGLIYFTDGYGIYPERMPDYDVIFAFLEEDENRAPVPPWSMKVIFE
ncbi:MAG: hypothetical protein IJ379_03015 [Lachnospiraceae bacterium]|nr:hypothetical protein [Lachnospiraceae bacterium]